MKTPLTTFFVAFITCSTLLAEKPATIAEQLDQDNPLVISFLKKLSTADIGKKVKGLRLSDGTIELQKATLLGFLNIASKKQHIYTFRTSDGVYSYVWIDPKGQPLEIPAAPGDTSGENAHVLSGDTYTFTEVAPGDGLVVLTGTTLKWLQGLEKSP